MRIIVVLAMSAALGLVAAAQEPGDGFYLLATSGSAQLRASDGQVLYLGAAVRFEPLGAALVASDNAGTRFELMFELDGEVASRVWHVLVVGGQAHRQRSRGAISGKSSLSFEVVGAEAGERVGRYCGVAPKRRSHPRHALLVHFEPVRAQCAPGDGPVEVVLHLRNCGDAPIVFLHGLRSRGPRNNQFDFVGRRATRPLPDIGGGEEFGGRVKPIDLAPGAVFTARVDLRHWFALDQPGSYRILGSYYLRIVDRENTWTTLWDDQATAELTLDVTETR